MIDFDGRCPFCGSDDVELSNPVAPEWGNDDQGWMEEDWFCNSCKKSFGTHARVEVVHRELRLTLSCPYCGEIDYLASVDSGVDGMEAYRCDECHRYFWIRDEEYYKALEVKR